MKNLNLQTHWQPPLDWRKITTIDAHTGGEPFRVIIGGFPELVGANILERRRFAKENFDNLRKALMFEPRGHADMYGCVLTPPVSEDADIGVLFTHNEGYSTMCGHGIIALTKVLLDAEFFPKTEPETTLKIDTPAGLVTAHARIVNNSVDSVYFHNVPAFVVALDEWVEVHELGKVRYDLAFGGAFYAYVNAKDVGLTCLPNDFRALIEKGMQIKNAVMNFREMPHPFEKDLSFLYGTIFIDEAESPKNHSRNVCIFANGEVDRSPTGTGVSARLAIHYARNEIKIGDSITIESIIGSKFTGRVFAETTFGGHQAIIPEVEGTAFITGKHEFLFDPKDEFPEGFILR